MRTFFSIFFIVLVTLGLFIHDAEARRFGGGRNFGFSRPTSSFSHPTSASSSAYGYARNQTPFGQNASSPGSTLKKWAGPLAGLLAGGLLASLFMGKGTGILSWLLIGGLLLLLFSFFRKRSGSAPQYQPSPQAYRDDNVYSFSQPEGKNVAQDAVAQFFRNNNNAERPLSSGLNNAYPAGFDAPAFLRDAKVQFIRLQAANDQKNANDLREFTTPEVFAEIQMQWHERGNAENKTNVIAVEAELLGVDANSQAGSSSAQPFLASVRFTGTIQENPNEPAGPFTETWYFRKDMTSSHWLVAGVEQ